MSENLRQMVEKQKKKRRNIEDSMLRNETN